MTASVFAEGDDLRLPTRLIVAPEAGTFQPLPPETCTAEGEVVTAGIPVGTVEALGRSVPVTSAFGGFLMGMLALPGERVRAGQPIAWLHTIDAA
jgi:biotin carboxyl carrier protein